MNIQQQIEALSGKISELAKQQQGLSRQILALMDELDSLKKQAAVPAEAPPVTQVVEVKEVIAPPQPARPAAPPPTPKPQATPTGKSKSTTEEFIGGNLTSKAGILITIIGIFIGSKYAIEHNMVSPMVRVIAGYVSGLVLIGIALNLKKKYEQYSSVLMGGGLAVLYFITYIAYSFYSMMPQTMAFVLMLVFTVGTVYAALLYNRIIIAHLGLVGAYAIPILLSDNSGRYEILFSYIAIINAGILVLSFRKNWKSLFYVSYVLTWLIYGSWFTFHSDENFSLGFTFLSIYFVIFYATFLAYKLIKKEQYSVSDVSVLLSNAFLFYGFGYGLLSERADLEYLVGAFTLLNAVIHLVISLIIRKLQLADKALFFLLLGLVMVFVTIAVPVQLDGNWVTLLWTAEAVLVFVVGRTQQRQSYEKLGVILILLSFGSLIQDWGDAIDWSGYQDKFDTPVFNILFVSGLLVCVAQGVILYMHHNKKPANVENPSALHLQFYNSILPAIFLLTAYFLFEREIALYFDRIHNSAAVVFRPEINSNHFCATLLYSMIFTAIVTFINQRWIKNNFLSAATLLGAGITIIGLLISGLNTLNHLSMNYYKHPQTYFGVWNVLERYVLIAAAALLLVLCSRTVKLFKDPLARPIFSVFVQVVILTILSFEYLNWASMKDTGNEYKLGLSILWSVYALGLVVLGINKKKKHWRLTGICFFLITVVKLFLYDLNQTSTISKTISFISLGVILLLVSYLYNRYKHVILADDEE